MRSIPPFTDNPELDAWNQEVAQYLLNLPSQPVYNQGTGIITDPVDESIVGFTERYLHIRYADDRIGTNFSNSPTNRFYYGVKNDTGSVESTDPAEYTWFEVEGGFSIDKSLYYRNLGGRAADIYIGTVAPNYKWTVDDGSAIDLDDLLGTGVIGTDELADRSVTTIKIALGAVTSDELNSGAVTLSKLDTTGTPSTSSFLNGEMEWVTPRTGWFLEQTVLTGIATVDNTMLGGHIFVDEASSEAIGKFMDDTAEIGSTLVFINTSAIVANLVYPAGTFKLLNDGSEEITVEVSPNGRATCIKVGSNRWVVEGLNLATSIYDPSEDYLITEGSDYLITESDDYILLE